MTELKPCPFCGGEAEIKEITDMGGRQFQIRCTNCPTDVGRYWYWERKKVVEAWNRREEYLDFDEWCDDCKEYDHERHCCPRWNRVIRDAVKEVTEPRKGRWENTGECEERGTVRYICSECGRDDWHFPLSKISYCWNCGARMEN